jgi:hypothetical protein
VSLGIFAIAILGSIFGAPIALGFASLLLLALAASAWLFMPSYPGWTSAEEEPHPRCVTPLTARPPRPSSR